MPSNNLFSEYIGGGRRGCGYRIPHALYLTVATSVFSKPLEHFVIDPPIPYKHKFTRSPRFVWNNKTKAFDIVMWVGEKYYPMPWDFLEEARHIGISKRIPKNIDFSKISSKSRLILVHKNVIPEFEYEVEKTLWLRTWCGENHKPCTFANRDLSIFVNNKQHRLEFKNSRVFVKTPSVIYSIHYPILPEVSLEITKDGKEKLVYDKDLISFKPAIFACFWIGGIEYVSPDMKVPKEIKEKAEQAGVPFKVVGE